MPEIALAIGHLTRADCRAAEQRDELATFHGSPLLRLKAGHYHTVSQERRCASQQKLRGDVADGSKPEELTLSITGPLYSLIVDVDQTFRDFAFVPQAAVSNRIKPELFNHLVRTRLPR